MHSYTTDVVASCVDISNTVSEAFFKRLDLILCSVYLSVSLPTKVILNDGKENDLVIYATSQQCLQEQKK